MRILHVTDRLSARGGADWHLLGVLAELVRRDDVTLCVRAVDGTAEAPCPVTLLEPRADPRSELERVCASRRPDLIHVHNELDPAVLAWAAERGAVMTLQDHRSFCPGRGKLTLDEQPCFEPLDRERCARCFTDEGYAERIWRTTSARLEAVREMRAVTVLSRYMARELTSAGVAHDRVHVVRPVLHGVDRGASPSGPPCVLFAGRLVRAKGVHDAVDAWQASRVDLPLVFAGTGPERSALEQRGAEVLGWLSRGELSGVYRRARALLMPSRWQEPLGIVGPEALFMGIPVVAWQSGAIGEWHPDPELPRWGDVAALADRLGEQVRELRPARPSPAPLEGFDTAELMARLLRIYRCVLD